MKYNRFVIILMLCIYFLHGHLLTAQKIHPDPSLDIERGLRNVAGNIIQNTTFRIINSKTGETFEDSKKLPTEAGYKVESPYNEWRYWNGVMNIGFLALGEMLDDPQFTEYAKKNVSFVFDHDPFFKKCYEAKTGHTGMEQKFRMALLDDCGAMGAGVLAVYNIDHQQRYREYIEKAADYIMNKEKRLEDGTFCRSVPYKMTVWGDDLYMSVPFLARMGALTDEQKYFDEAAKQVILFNKYLWDEQKQLFYHGWYDDIQQNGVAFWGRCNGWIIMAQIELLELIPVNHPERQVLIRLLNRQITSLNRYQDASGLWHQLIDKENTYLETSSSAIYTYAIAKAINKGWLDTRYAYVATQGWEGISGKILADGQVEGICAGTGISPATYYYATRPTPLNDIHGIGAILLAGSEVMKLYKKGISKVWGL
jgi:rhamnogalacturonyl hydrolase YesR